MRQRERKIVTKAKKIQKKESKKIRKKGERTKKADAIRKEQLIHIISFFQFFF